jgi:hypothetical protein
VRSALDINALHKKQKCWVSEETLSREKMLSQHFHRDQDQEIQ